MPEITKELREQLLAEWVEALESGEYTQIDRYLHNEAGFCCLGVGCEVVRKHVSGIFVKADRGMYSYDGNTAITPRRVQEAIGLRTWCGRHQVGESETSLVEMNGEGATFKEIAAVIRSRPPGLFVD